jgi:hypothetical protein
MSAAGNWPELCEFCGELIDGTITNLTLIAYGDQHARVRLYCDLCESVILSCHSHAFRTPEIHGAA